MLKGLRETKLIIFCALTMVLGFLAYSQTAPVTVPTSVNANLLLDAAGPEQRKSLSAIYLILCPGVGSGSGFLLEGGMMVTNSHVVATCTEANLLGIGTTNKKVTFSKIINDTDRDLAILIPTETLTNGLKLASIDNPLPGTTVSTWGYPFLYNGATPLLSVGYVSGYRETDSGQRKAIKHIVVNGAFNHGNSGGPLLVDRDNQVVGIVVLTFNFYPPVVKQIIDQLSKQQSGFQCTITQPNGSRQSVSEAQVTSAVLNEFYQKTQVMIGEAIAVSELRTMLKDHASDLPRNSEKKADARFKAAVIPK